MMRFLMVWVVALAGAAAVLWVGAGYVGSNPLALAVTVMIGVCYLAGVVELWRYRRATAGLAEALAALDAPPEQFDGWLAKLPASLRQAVRRRIEGERVALPGPALSPYLSGLLVLLGMLGTFLGMVATLRGTGVALESAADLQAMRAALAAPVKGLGFAFGTSVAGVAASAMLGLLTALCRRERVLEAQALDGRIATTLRIHAPARQRETVIALLEQQSAAAPLLADRLETLVAALERRQAALDERLSAGQADFHARTEAAYVQLADAVGRSLRESATESGQAAGAGIRPLVETLMNRLAQETTAWRDISMQGVQRQLDGLSVRFETLAESAGAQWTQALAFHEQRLAMQAEAADAVQRRYAETFEQRAGALLDEVGTRLEAAVDRIAEGWQAALVKHEQAGQAAAQAHQSLAAQTAGLLQEQAALLSTRAAEAQADQAQRSQALMLAHQSAVTQTADLLKAHAETYAGTVAAAHADWQSAQSEQDAQRLADWRGTLASLAAELQAQWARAGEEAAGQQQAARAALEQTATALCAQLQAQATRTMDEVGRLVDAAKQAPQAAASLLSELHERLADSTARDAALLEDRAHVLQKLDAVLDSVGQASAGQQAAVQSLVESTAQTLTQVSAQFADQVESGTGRLSDAVEHVVAGAAEVGSLGEALGAAVQAFGQCSDVLLAQLQQIETALSQSMVRSDEQLAYYVAQAREVVDLSVLSQRQIIEDLQRLAAQVGADPGKRA